ncbi:MAG: efflux RND transporter periplasmic adaptor subunit, partial [Planctomycetia bacterium]|nr:efflux RND transporter periplasmic adaptor subunit [Planctomycetia bacterium]
EVTGRIDAERVVDIRSRVTGYLTKVHFQDGQFVSKGDLLYEIDDRPARAQLDEAVGVIERLLGEQRFLKVQVDRFEKLVAKGAASQQDFDSYKAKLDENAGSLITAQAQHEAARLNVEFCSITAPITGQIGRTQLQVGNLITQDNTTLTTIVSIDPIFVYFNVDEPTFLRLMNHARESGRGPGIGQQATLADIGLVDDVDRTYPYRSEIDFLNNQVDTSTATITMRGRLDNPYSAEPSAPRPPLFRPGMFARVRLPLGDSVERIFVPEFAVGSIQDRKIVWVVGNDSLVSAREVTLGQKLGSWIAVVAVDSSRPISTAERIVVRGLQRCREGKEVRPSLAAEDSLELESLVVPVSVARQQQDSEPSAAEVSPPPAAAAVPPPIVLPQTSSAVEPLPPPGNQSP